VNGRQLNYETHGFGRPLVVFRDGLLAIDLKFVLLGSRDREG
jgi:hypothetical protein